jgi:hypothetical protein
MPSTATVRNSVLADVTTLAQTNVTLTCAYNGFWNTTPSGTPGLSASATPFQTVQAGAHYLAPGGPFFNKGTTSIDATLLAELPTLTTFAPATQTAAITGDRLIGRRVQRDADGFPDLGYH